MQYTPIPVIDRPVDPPPPQDGPRTARCADLSSAVGQADLDDSLFTGSLFSSAVNEYASGAGRPWRFDPATSPALLLRALAKLSMHAPDARSASARLLLDIHVASGRDAS